MVFEGLRTVRPGNTPQIEAAEELALRQGATSEAHAAAGDVGSAGGPNYSLGFGKR